MAGITERMPSSCRARRWLSSESESRIGQAHKVQRHPTQKHPASAAQNAGCPIPCPWKAARPSENQVRGGMHRQGEFGQTFVNRGPASVGRRRISPVSLALALLTAFFVVPADMVGFVHARIQRRRTRFALFLAGPHARFAYGRVFFRAFLFFILAPHQLPGRRAGKVQPRRDHAGLHQMLVRIWHQRRCGRALSSNRYRGTSRGNPSGAPPPRDNSSSDAPAAPGTQRAVAPVKSLRLNLDWCALQACRRQRVSGIKHLPWRFAGFHFVGCIGTSCTAQISLARII